MKSIFHSYLHNKKAEVKKLCRCFCKNIYEIVRQFLLLCTIYVTLYENIASVFFNKEFINSVLCSCVKKASCVQS